MKAKSVFIPTALFLLIGSSTYASSGSSEPGDVSFQCIAASDSIVAFITSSSSTLPLSIQICSVGPASQCALVEGTESLSDSAYSAPSYETQGSCTFKYGGETMILKPS